MKNKSIFVLLSVVLLSACLISACGSGPDRDDQTQHSIKTEELKNGEKEKVTPEITGETDEDEPNVPEETKESEVMEKSEESPVKEEIQDKEEKLYNSNKKTEASEKTNKTKKTNKSEKKDNSVSADSSQQNKTGNKTTGNAPASQPSKTTANSKPQSTPKPTSTPKPQTTTKPTPTPAPHTHNWTKQYTTKHHDAVTHVVHHEATGHNETRVVTEAWDEPIYENRSICNGCGADITNNIDHIFECDPGSYSNKNIQVGTKHHDAVTENVWIQDSAAWDETVTDSAAWDEQVVSGYVCGCGATK